MKSMNIEVTIGIDRVRNLLCCAFEGGSNYWYVIVDRRYPPGFDAADYREGGKAQPPDDYWHWSQILPLQDGGSLVIGTKDDDEIDGSKQWTLDAQAIARGLVTMAEKYPRHYGSVLADNEDAETGDVFLQCCLFGKLVFG